MTPFDLFIGIVTYGAATILGLAALAAALGLGTIAVVATFRAIVFMWIGFVGGKS